MKMIELFLLMLLCLARGTEDESEAVEEGYGQEDEEEGCEQEDEEEESYFYSLVTSSNYEYSEEVCTITRKSDGNFKPTCRTISIIVNASEHARLSYALLLILIL